MRGLGLGRRHPWADDFFEDDGLCSRRTPPARAPCRIRRTTRMLARLQARVRRDAARTRPRSRTRTRASSGPRPSRADVDETGYLDFSVKSPWEKLARSVERAVRGWLASSESALAAASSPCDRPEHGGRHLRCLRARVDHATHWRRDPYSVLLYYPPGAPPNVPARRVAPDATFAAPDATLAAPDATFAAPATRTPPPRARHPPRPRALLRGSRRRHLGRAALVRSVSAAWSNRRFRSDRRFSTPTRRPRYDRRCPTDSNPRARPRTGPSFAPARPARGVFVGRADGDGGAAASRRIRWTGAGRMDALPPRIAGVGLAETTRERLAATGAVASWNPVDDAHADDAHASARSQASHRQTMDRRPPRISARGSGRNPVRVGRRRRRGAAFMARVDGGPTVARRRRARTSNANACVNAAGGVRTPRRVDDERHVVAGRYRDPDVIELDARVGATRPCVDRSAAATARTR